MRDLGHPGRADGLVREVVEHAPVHVDAVQPAPYQGGEEDEKDRGEGDKPVRPEA